MLRIKEKIDLKELEKFGFLSDHYGDYRLFNDYNIDIITVWSEDRTIDVDGDDTAINTLYDLIKADMVERI